MNRQAIEELPSSLRRWKGYPHYKESDIEWFGTIPHDWKVYRLKWLCEEITDGSHFSPQAQTDGKPYVTVSNIVDHHIDVENAARISEADFEALERNGCRPKLGDVLFSKDGTVGKVALVSRDDFVILSSLAILRPSSNINSRFLAYFLGSNNGIEQIASRFAGAALKRITLDVIVNLLVPKAPLEEQLSIANFLDRETAKIDVLVSNKELLIELLEEKRAALITRAVTKGLDSNVPMKDSGVEWLGKIPVHWQALALSRVTLSRCDGPFGSGLKSEHYSADGVRVIRLQNIGWTAFLDADQAYIGEAYAGELGDHSVIADDLLIAGLGDEGQPVGRACVAPDGIEPAMVKADCFRFRLDRRQVLPRFAAYQLSATATGAAGSLATGATRARMNLTVTALRKVAMPPLDEQRIIVDAVNRETAKIDALVARVREGIERLKEYRSALISAAVTGKIDVQGK